MFVRTGLLVLENAAPMPVCLLANVFGVAHHGSASTFYGATRALVTEIS